MQRVLLQPLAHLVNDEFPDVHVGIPAEMQMLLVRHTSDTLQSAALCHILRSVVHAPMSKMYASGIVLAITPMIGSPDENVRAAAFEALMNFRVVEAKLVLLEHRDFGARANANRFLREATRSEETVGAVLQLAANHHSFLVREAAAKALGGIASVGHELAVQTLADLLADEAREVREAASGALRDIGGTDDPVVIAAVIRQALSEDWPVRSAALVVLAAIAPSKRELVEDLATAMQNGGATMAKMAAARVLQSMRSVTELRDNTQRDSEEQHDDIAGAHGSPPSSLAGPRWGDESEEED
mmetsp:Transcript_14291/g.39297  ORF Transcript_14291/g.39297 Transcript_14291/m.39297 type:complete len:300 (-) Transcript_14291:276-1175(-)